MDVGQFNILKIKKETSIGLFLENSQGEQVLLPNESCPDSFDLEDELEVFIYKNQEGGLVATNTDPKIFLYEFAYLTIKSVDNDGAFVDWGLKDDLFVPKEETGFEMTPGDRRIVYLDLDEESNSLFGSTMYELYLQNETIEVAEGDQVDLFVLKHSDLGFNVAVNHEHIGLVYHNEVFQELQKGDSLKGYVKKIRDENMLDVSIQPLGYRNASSSNVEMIIEKLKNNNGVLALHDKSSPDEISEQLGISKKAFKQAIGALYKKKLIELGDKEIKML